MSASEIPNLSTLRRGGVRGLGRGRGDGFSSPSSSHAAGRTDQDKIVQRTDLDAAAARLSAVEKGYLEDPFASLVTSNGDVVKRLPLMNRGTYVRTTAIDRLVDRFLGAKPSGRKQIISLGAGSDTRFFRLKQNFPDTDLVYHELDFPSNTTAKIKQLRRPPFVNLAAKLCRVDLAASNVHISSDGAGLISSESPNYFIHAQDVRMLSADARDQGLGNHQPPRPSGVLTTIPTLLISECCLIYLSPEEADSVLHHFTSMFSDEIPLGIVIYEPIRPHDAFGRTMVSNLMARGIHLQTLNAFDSLEAQRARLRKHGFGREQGEMARAEDLDFIWKQWIDESEKERVEGVEWMDEVEEWRLLMQHYCVAWGCRSGGSEGEEVFDGWKGVPSSDSQD